MAIRKTKIKSLAKMVKKMKKSFSYDKEMNFKDFNQNFDKEYFDKIKIAKKTRGGRYTTPDGKIFKGKFDPKKFKTEEAKPVKLRGKFSKKPVSKQKVTKKEQPIGRKSKDKPSRVINRGDQAANPPVGEEDSGGGGL